MIEFDKDCAWDNFATPNYTLPSMPFYIQNSSNLNSTLFNQTAALFARKRKPVSLRQQPVPQA